MNIRSLFPNLSIRPIRSVDKAKTDIKSELTQDRDGNGQQSFNQNANQQRPPMTDEMFEKSMEHLRNLPQIKDFKWQVDQLIIDQRRFVIVKDNEGHIIRRIPELDLWSLSMDLGSSSGNLIKKTA